MATRWKIFQVMAALHGVCSVLLFFSMTGNIFSNSSASLVTEDIITFVLIFIAVVAIVSVDFFSVYFLQIKYPAGEIHARTEGYFMAGCFFYILISLVSVVGVGFAWVETVASYRETGFFPGWRMTAVMLYVICTVLIAIFSLQLKKRIKRNFAERQTDEIAGIGLHLK